MSKRILTIDMKSGVLTAIVCTVDGKAMQIVAHAMVPVGVRPLEEALVELVQDIAARHVVTTDAESSLDSGQSSLFCDESHVAFESEVFSFRNLSLPFTDTKTISKILPLELEENAPVKMERLLVDALITSEDKSNSQIIAAMIDRELLDRRLTILCDLGIDPERVTISGIPTALSLIHTPELPADFLILTIDLQRASLILVRARKIILIRPLVFDSGLASGFQITQTENQEAAITVVRPENMEKSFQSLCTTIRQTLQSLFIADIISPLALYLNGSVGSWAGVSERIEAGLGSLCQSCAVVQTDPAWSVIVPENETWNGGIMADAVNLGWQATSNWRGFNFRKEGFAVKKSFTRNKKLALLLGLPLLSVGVLTLIYFWIDYSRLVKKHNDLTAQINAIFTSTLPEVTRIVDPVQQLQVKIKEVGQSSMNPDGHLPTSTIVHLLAEISATIPSTLDVRLARFVVDDTGLRIKGNTDTFNSVDAIKKGLEQSSAFSNVEISTATLDAKTSKIRFELKLTMKGGV